MRKISKALEILSDSNKHTKAVVLCCLGDQWNIQGIFHTMKNTPCSLMCINIHFWSHT